MRACACMEQKNKLEGRTLQGTPEYMSAGDGYTSIDEDFTSGSFSDVYIPFETTCSCIVEVDTPAGIVGGIMRMHTRIPVRLWRCV